MAELDNDPHLPPAISDVEKVRELSNKEAFKLALELNLMDKNIKNFSEVLLYLKIHVLRTIGGMEVTGREVRPSPVKPLLHKYNR